MAKLCVEGLHSTYAYCDKHAIPYDKCGKLVVAHSELEIKRLEAQHIYKDNSKLLAILSIGL